MENSDYLDNKLNSYSDVISERTLGPLRRAGIETVRDLLNLTDTELRGVQGFGEKCYQEITSVFFAELEKKKESLPGIALHDWIHEELDERRAAIVERLYGLIDGNTHTLDEVGEIYKISRERTRQIKQRALDKLKTALENKRIDKELPKEFDRLANENVRLSDVNSLSLVYNNTGVAALLTDALDRNALFNDKRLKSVWLVDNSEKILQYLDTITEWLESQIGFVKVSQLSKQSGVPLKIIDDLVSVKRDGGYIALINGYRKDGIDRASLILNLLRDNIKPMKIDEISQKTGLTIDVLRGFLYRIPGVVNVGNSVFALEEYGYSGKDTKDLIIEYLEECNEPKHINDITKYVLHRREVDKSAVSSAIYTRTDLFTRFSNGYVALAKWGYQSDAQKRIVYEVPTRDALMTVFKNNPERSLSNRDLVDLVVKEFGDKATCNYTSIGMETKKMEEEGILEVLGTRTKYYRLLAERSQ